MTPAQLLIADDQPHVVEALRLLLKNEGIQADAASSPAAVLGKIKSRPYDVLLVDLNYSRDTTSGAEGLDLIDQVQAIDDALPVVAMTAWGSVELAVEAMKRGVCDFVLKPWENSRLVRTLWGQIELGRRKRDDRRRQHEREQAERDAGRALLPQSLPSISGVEIAAAALPLGTLGGDYFDVQEPRPGILSLAIADVVGKGVPAALLMSNVQASVRAHSGSGFSPAELASSLNHSVRRNTTSGKFVTLFYAELDTQTRRLVYTNAGHCPPVLFHSCGETARLEAGGAVLGVFHDWQYREQAIQLASGDRLLLFTDGITDAAGASEELAGTTEPGTAKPCVVPPCFEARPGPVPASQEEFGEDRLIELARALRHLPAQVMCERILDSVQRYCGGPAGDDITLLVLGFD